MKHEDYVSFEQAKALKELGFDWECETFWDDEGSPRENQWVIKRTRDYFFTDYYEDCTIKRPTLAQAQKWLREVKGIDVLIDKPLDGGYFYTLETADTIDTLSEKTATYEQALSDGIDKALELLKLQSK